MAALNASLSAGCYSAPNAAATAPGANMLPHGKSSNSSSHNAARNGKGNYVYAVGPNGPFRVGGKVAKAMLALASACDKGVTAQEVSTWAYRFSAYCFVLRHEHSLVIETLREDHEGGWHGRHVLRSPITILPIDADIEGEAEE